MQTYAEFQPTSFDVAGLRLPTRQHWLVLPTIQTRDSDALERSNFHIAREALGDGDDVEVHQFGHWACGWFEVIIVRPDTPSAETAQGICIDLENHPVLDEYHFSELEWEEHVEYVEQECERAAAEGDRDVDPATFDAWALASNMDWGPRDRSPDTFALFAALEANDMLAAE